MQYFIFPFLLLIYFELLGRLFFLFIKKDHLEFSFLIGFLFAMAVLYITIWPITALNGSFYLLLIVCVVYFLISLFFILKNIKRISLKFNWKLWVLLFVLLGFEIFISYRRTLGEVHGFDTLYYLNTVSFNIGNHELNSLHPHFGTYPNTDVQWITYVFQSFYYFVEVIIYSVRKIFGIIGMSFETLPAYVWSFHIFFQMFFIGSCIESIKEIKTKNIWLKTGFIILLVLFLGNLYYNNVYGFIGNNYRMSIHAIATIYLFRYLKENDLKEYFIFNICMLGMCAVSSTGTFSFAFILFGLFFCLCDRNKNIIKYYSVALFVPLLNIMVTQFGTKWFVFIGTLVFCIVVYLLNDFIIKIFRGKRIRIGFVVMCFVAMAALSYSLTHNIFDFNTFINNYSEIADMSWDYFMFNDLRHWIFNLIVLIPLFYYLIKNHKSTFSVMSWVLIIVFFNPFVCTFMNKINWVYYRSYDIIINQFTIIYFINYMIDDINLEYSWKVVSGITIISSMVLAYIQVPMYYHESFIPDDDYNPIFKIENKELEVIYNVRNMVYDFDIDNPRIITGTFYMPSFIEHSSYLIGKEKRYNNLQYDDISFNLYLIFFPFDWDGAYDTFYPEGYEADYNNCKYYLDNCDYDIMVVDYNQYYQNEDGEYRPLTELVEESGYSQNEYSTSQYAVYYLD